MRPTRGFSRIPDEHPDPDHQLWIDRGPANVGVERPQLLPHLTQIKEPVNLAKDVIPRNVLIQTKIVNSRSGAACIPIIAPPSRANHAEDGITPPKANQP
jgi:hypothetical protein